MFHVKVHRGMTDWRAVHVYNGDRQLFLAGLDAQDRMIKIGRPGNVRRVVIAPSWPRSRFGSLQYRIEKLAYRWYTARVQRAIRRLPN